MRPIDDEAEGSFPRLLLTTEEAFRALGCKKTKGWELIKCGEIAARRFGGRTMIEAESVRAFAARLPRANAA